MESAAIRIVVLTALLLAVENLLLKAVDAVVEVVVIPHLSVVEGVLQRAFLVPLMRLLMLLLLVLQGEPQAASDADEETDEALGRLLSRPDRLGREDEEPDESKSEDEREKPEHAAKIVVSIKSDHFQCLRFIWILVISRHEPIHMARAGC